MSLRIRRSGIIASGGTSTSLAGPAIYIIAGQSNAMGPSDPLTSPPALPRADVRCSVYNGGVLEGTSPRDLAEFAFRGVEVGLGTTLADAGRNVALSKWIWNATSMLNNWTPWIGDASAVTSTAMLSDAVVQTRTFIEQLIAEDPTRQPYVAGFYWSQWESDAAGTLASAELYVQELRVLIDRLRAEFHPDLPVWISTVSNNFTGDPGTYTPANLAAIEAGHATVAAEYTGVEIVNTDDLAFGDLIHYTADAQLELGADRLAPLVLAASPLVYEGNATLRRVSLYPSKAAAETAAGGSPVYMSPADNRVWAVEDPTGEHFVPADEWPVAVDKAMRFFPNTQSLSASKVIGGTIPSADVPILNTGEWYIRVRPNFDSTSETTLRRLLHKSSANSVYYLGSVKQFNVRMGAVDALSIATTFVPGDEFVIAVNFTQTSNNVSFYKNGVLLNTVSQASNFSGSASAVQIGAGAFTAQWDGEFDEPIVGPYTP